MSSFVRSVVIGTAPVDANRNMWVDAQMSTPDINANGVSGFAVTSNASTNGTDIGFSISDTTGMASITLVRAEVPDIAQAIVLQSWSASQSTFTWSDTDKLLQQMGQAYYWLKLEPVNTLNGSEAIVGPQFILLNPSLLPPIACTDVSASHAAAVNGTVKITVNVSGIASGNSVKIYVSGYQGNASFVAFAQHGSAPLQFTLDATGETVTLKAIQVSTGGAEAASGPTCTLTLNSTATVPAKVEGVLVTQLSTGNQVSWPSSLEVGVTQYLLYRGQRGDVFAGASLLATISATGAGTLIYLDTAGLSGDFQYFVIAHSGIGNSVESNAANPVVLFSSSQIPTNVPANTTNTATLVSDAVGGSATISIYGPGGVGTSFTRTLGFGTVTRPAGSIAGLAFNTRYFIVYSAGNYFASTTYTDSLPDGYEWVGAVTTCPATGSFVVATVNLDWFNAGTFYILSAASELTPGFGYGTASVVFSGGSGTYPIVSAFCSGGSVTSYSVDSSGSMTSIGGLTADVVVDTPYSGGGGSTAQNGARYVTVS